MYTYISEFIAFRIKHVTRQQLERALKSSGGVCARASHPEQQVEEEQKVLDTLAHGHVSRCFRLVAPLPANWTAVK